MEAESPLYFTYPVVIINANGTLMALDNVGCWQIRTQHLDDSWRPRVPRTKRESKHTASAASRIRGRTDEMVAEVG